MTDDDGAHAPASHEDDFAYFQRRAAWHEARAACTTDSSTRSLHLRFARLYQARALS